MEENPLNKKYFVKFFPMFKSTHHSTVQYFFYRWVYQRMKLTKSFIMLPLNVGFILHH
jgi:hypothetical protein